MIAVSNTYNPYTITRDVDMIVTFDAVSPMAANRATYAATDKQSFSNLAQLNTREFVDVNYATCENGLTKLDGSWHYLDTVITTQHIGWWTNILSDAYGAFSTAPKFTATLSQVDDVVGYTLHFASSNPVKRCLVTTYNGNDEIYSEEFTSDNASMIIDLPASDFDKVDVEILETLEPYRRVKLSNFVFGITKRWTRDNILSASISEEADITGNTLPINELTVEFDNSNGDFDLIGNTKTYVYKTASKTAIITSPDKNEIANLNQLRDNITQGYNYATCENSLVELKGEHHYLPPASLMNYQIGYVNDTLSNFSGQYQLKTPTLKYTWNKPISTSGLRLYFGEKNYATEISVSAYNGVSLVDRIVVDNDSPTAEIEFEVGNYDYLEITFLTGVAPYRFIKLHEVQFLRYGDSWYTHLSKKQKLQAFFVINGEKVNMGNSYMFDSLEQTNGGLTAKITAKDYVRQFNEQKYTGSYDSATIGTIIDDMLSGTGVSAEYSPDSLSEDMVYNTTPKDTTKRAAIHYFSQAVQATCTMTREGKLKIMPFDVSSSVDTITLNELYSSDIIRMGDYVNMIRLTVKNTYVDPETSNTYYGGSGLYYREIENDCVYTNYGQWVANWLLEQYERRTYFEMKTRGNPAVELGDTVRIIDKNGTAYLAVVYSQEFVYGQGGGLYCNMKAVM